MLEHSNTQHPSSIKQQCMWCKATHFASEDAQHSLRHLDYHLHKSLSGPLLMKPVLIWWIELRCTAITNLERKKKLLHSKHHPTVMKPLERHWSVFKYSFILNPALLPLKFLQQPVRWTLNWSHIGEYVEAGAWCTVTGRFCCAGVSHLCCHESTNNIMYASITQMPHSSLLHTRKESWQ